jgi:bifunctional UDP-N-acetylglucosamine pyrophosphorylase/glucosamine-1-phosphate N-acetyltransferase
MLLYVLDLVRELKIKKSVVVLGHKYEQVKKIIPSRVKTVLQRKIKGTADAVKEALGALGGFSGMVLVLYGDIPLIKKETLKRLIDYHKDSGSEATVLISKLDKPAGYGRILRDRYANISGIIEEKDADDFQKEIKEINSGIICFNKGALLKSLKSVRSNNRKREYYLTDCIKIIYKNGGIIDSLDVLDSQEIIGINSRVDLAKVNYIMRGRINELFMKNGVAIIDKENVYIDYGAKIGRDTTIYPFTVIASSVKIGRRCSIGPFVHLRDGTRLGDDIILGNFTEVVRSAIGNKTLMKHFGYLGDSQIGQAVNIGAGTVTANFDGRKKSQTVIKDKAFIGSDTVFVAPVKVGRRCITGAGSVLTRYTNLADNSIVVGMPARSLKKRGKNG